jgi:hypothetical protein
MKAYASSVVRPDWGPRPAGKPDECFYCNQRVSTPHLPDCVCLKKWVKVTFSVTTLMAVPEVWDDAQIKFSKDGSSWCKNNLIEHLAEMHADDKPCLCEYASIAEVKPATAEDLAQQEVDPRMYE